MQTIKPLPHFDIVLTVFNQENLIEKLLYGIFSNTTTPFNLIMVFDGCSDRTEVRARSYIKRYASKNLKKFVSTTAPNVYETRANNIGFRLTTSEFLITLQDDMLIREYGWERRLTFPLRKFSDVIAVTSRRAHDIVQLGKWNLDYKNAAAHELNNLSRDTFAVRDVINRGPIAFNGVLLRQMNFLNDSYAPCDLDDADLSLRAWEQHNYRVGAYWIDYASPLHWGKSRTEDSTMEVMTHAKKNAVQIAKDHAAYIASGKKHTEDITLPAQEVDYVGVRPYRFPSFIYRPFRINKKEIIRLIKKTKGGMKEGTLTLLEKIGVKNARGRGIKKIITFQS